MPITRTPIHDDDGSGTTGTILDNAWKQELYGQIDAALPAPYAYGLWTPTDASGAGMTFGPGTWARWGRLVYAQVQLLFPTNTNTALALVDGLPAPANTHSGLYMSFGGPAVRVWIASGDTKLAFLNPVTGAQMKNVDMSGGNIVVHGVYMTP